jgi:trans-aconitate methyltransferase
MSRLVVPAEFAVPDIITELSPLDSMFDGRSDHYLGVGNSALNVINTALEGSDPKTILDLPCGFGRVTRMLRARFPGAHITACDLDRDAVDFTTATFGAKPVYSVPDFQNLNLGEKFDLIWVGSLLTHMPEHLTRTFLDFAARHMRAGSRLIVTTHGEFVAERLRTTTYGLTEAAARGLYGQYLTSGYGYRGYDGNVSYGISLSARAWFETLLANSNLRLQSYHERGWDQHQDVLVLRPAKASRNAFWRKPSQQLFAQENCAPPLPDAEQARQDAETVPGFDEQWYCETNPDVKAAKNSGVLPSGLFHYCAYGWKEGRDPFNPQRNYMHRPVPVPSGG